MNILNQLSRPVKVVLMALVVLALTASLMMLDNYQQQEFEKILKGKAPTRKGEVKQDIINGSPMNAPVVAAAPSGGFTDQVRLGYTSGDQWEPAIAADRSRRHARAG